MALTPQNPGQVGIPNDLTEQAEGTVAIPNDPTEQAAGSVAIPVDLTEQAVGSVAIPNNPAESAVGSVAIPVNLTEQTVGSTAIPNNLTELALGVAPRTLDPILKLDFENQVYETTSSDSLSDIVTYSRNGSATFWNRRQDEQGRYETFLDTDYVGSVTNLILRSNDFTQAWNESNGCSVSATVETVLGFDAFRLTSNGSGTFPQVFQDVTESGDLTWSCYVKDVDVGQCALRINGTDVGSGGDGSQTYEFDFNGNFTLRSGTDTASLFANYVGDGWWEIGFSTTCTTATRALIYQAYNLTNTGSILVAQAQLTQSQKRLPNVISGASQTSDTFAETPRIEYDPITAEPLGYLAEGSSTNLCLRSEEFDDGVWTKNNVLITANDAVSPDSTNSADLADPNSFTTAHILRNFTLSTSSDYSLSLYVKPADADGARNRFGLFDATGGDWQGYVDINWNNGVPSTHGTFGTVSNIVYQNVGDGWYRMQMSSVTDVTNTAHRYYFYPDLLAGSGTFYIWGAQLEQLPFASSYIRTEGSSVFRPKDNMSGNVSAPESCTMTAVVVNDKDIPEPFANFALLELANGTANRRVLLIDDGNEAYFFASKNSTQTAFVLDSGTLINEATGEATFTTTVDTDNFRGYLNGTEFANDLDGASTETTTFHVGQNVSTSENAYCNIKKVIVHDEYLTPSEVAQIDSLEGITETETGLVSIPTNLTEQSVGALSAPVDLAEEPTTNLFLYSEQLDNGVWTGADRTILANQLPSPFGLGGNTSERFQAASTATSTPDVRQQVSLTDGLKYTVSYYVRQSSASWVQIRMSGGGAVGNPYANYDVGNGVLGFVDPDCEATISQPIGNVSGAPYYRITFTFTSDTTGLASAYLQLMQGANDTNGQSNAWTAGVGVYVWGAQLEQSPRATSYLKTEGTSLTEGQLSIPNNLAEQSLTVLPRTFRPVLNIDFSNEQYAANDNPISFEDLFTFGRGSTTASFWNRRKNRGGRWETFIDEDFVGTVTNYCTDSENMLTAGTNWTTTTATIERVDESHPFDAPVFKLTSDGVGTFPRLEQDIADSGVVCISFDVKRLDNSEYCVIRMGGTGIGASAATSTAYYFWWDGTFGHVSGDDDSWLKAEYLGDEWWRIHLANNNTSTTIIETTLYPAWNEAVVRSLLVTRASFTRSAKSQPYVVTDGTASSDTFTESARINVDPLTAEKLGLLSENSTSNLQEWSEELDRSTFTKTGLAPAEPVQPNREYGPDGARGMDKIREDGLNSQHFIQDAISFTSGTTYTWSVYAKKGERNRFRMTAGNTGVLPISVDFDLSDGTIYQETQGTGRIQDVGNGIYRCSVTATALSTASTNMSLYLIGTASGAVNTTYTGVTGNGLFLWGWQVEGRTEPSSYVYTDGGTTFRDQDDIRVRKQYIPKVDATVRAKFRLDNITSGGTGVSREIFFITNDTADFGLYMNGSGNITAVRGTNYSTAGNDGSYADRESQDVTFTWDDSAEILKTYSAGVNLATNTNEGNPWFWGNTTDIRLANRLGEGGLDEITFYEIVLSDAEVSLL